MLDVNTGKLTYILRMTKERPDLSSERAPHTDKTATSRTQPSDRK
jgi:hypothetical protein